MSGAAVLGVLCVVVFVVLAYVVGRLHSDLRRLSAELAALRADQRAPSAASTAATAGPDVIASPVEPARDTADEVPVITVMATQADDIDLSARRVASVTLARPLIKVASLSYGLRRALDDEHRFKIRYTMRQELRRQRKMRRRRRAARAPSMGWRR